MALSFSVFNKFKAIDGVTAPVRKMTKNVGRFGKTAVKAFRRSDRQAKKLNKTLKGILVGGGILAGVALLTGGIKSVTTQFVEFDDAIIAAGARFTDIGPDVDDFTDRIKGIKKAAREAGATTEFTAAQSAKAIDFMARAGFTSIEAIGGLVSMINLATASGEDFNRVADISSDLLGAFGLNVDDSAQKIKNLGRMNDVLVKAVNSANVTVESLFDTMKKVAPVATGLLGASLEEITALTMALGSSGIKGSDAMTALKNVYLRLAAPASKANKVLKALNISLDDGTGNARKMTDFMEELGEKTEGLGRIKRAAIFDILFGKFAIAGAKNLQDNIKNIKKFEKSLRSAGGTSQKTADLMRTSLGNRLKTLNSAFVEFGFRILENFRGKGVDALTAFTEAIRDVDVKPIIDGLKIVISVASIFFKILKTIVNFFGVDFIVGTSLAIAALIGLKLAVMGVTAAMAINPFGLAIIALAAIVLGIRAVIKDWKFLKMDFLLGWEFIKKKALEPFIATLEFISSIASKIGGFFGGGVDTEAVKTMFSEGSNISPNAGLAQTIRQETESRSRVSVDFSNLPKGTDVIQSGNVPGFDLALGFAGGQ